MSDEVERAYLQARSHSYGPSGGGGGASTRYEYERQYSQPPPTHHTTSPTDGLAPSWASSSSHHPSRHPASYSSHPYPYSYHYPPDQGPPQPPSSTTWGQWSSGHYGVSHPYYNSTSSQAAAGGRHIHSAPPPAERRPPTPPPPASPSQLTRPAPPPPASAPSPSRSESGTPPGRYRPGFQPDYDRPRTSRRPTPTSDPSGTAEASYSGDGRSPPAEAYLIIRPHRVPRGGWATAQESTPKSDSAGWTFELNVLQHPERGKALGVEPLRRGWPPLTPPLIVQLVVKDKDGAVVATDNATLARRLVHLTMSVELVSPEGNESRSLIRVRPPSPRGNVQPYYPASAPPPYSVQRTLLGSSVRTAQILTRDGQKGLYFIFQDMIVRPEGRYALEGKVLDLAGPPHIGTSIGITHPLTRCRTRPFDVIVPQEYPGPVPITSLSAEFLRQGERHLGRRPRNEEGDSDNEETAQPE
ncbi:hypothetical protein VHUM_00958 [Vanrija humicola]|uniref:Velvet domain-containing protein n=1 Tax=Vanrija humicola TaxID=5417 RepID=A0A7D8YZC9_VANHU|nr:hypothetical protein VHUM_00958 [Vanrija humicola]